MEAKEITKRLNLIPREVLTKQELLEEIAPIFNYAPSTLNLTFKFLIKNLLVTKLGRNRYVLYTKPIYYKKVESYLFELKEYFKNYSSNTRNSKKEEQLLEIFNSIAKLNGYTIKVTFKKM